MTIGCQCLAIELTRPYSGSRASLTQSAKNLRIVRALRKLKIPLPLRTTWTERKVFTARSHRYLRDLLLPSVANVRNRISAFATPALVCRILSMVGNPFLHNAKVRVNHAGKFIFVIPKGITKYYQPGTP